MLLQVELELPSTVQAAKHPSSPHAELPPQMPWHVEALSPLVAHNE